MHRYFSSLLRSERGSLLILVSAAALALMTATGVAVDMARAQTLQTRISSALDAAGLAAGATTMNIPTTNNPSTGAAWTQADWVQYQAQKYFNANFPSGSMGASAVTVTATFDPTSNIISLTASTTLPTTVMQVVGVTSVAVGATSQITRQNTGMELALVLDNTGSMNDPVNSSDSSVSKINALKCALAGNSGISSGSTFCSDNSQVTTGLLNILYGSNSTLSDLFISLVPFSDVVNIPTAQDSINSAGTGQTCVNARPTNVPSGIDGSVNVTYEGSSTPSTATIYMDQSEDPPSASSGNTLFTPVIPTTNTQTKCTKSNGHSCTQGSNGCSCTTTTTTTYTPSADCPTATLLPLTSSGSTIVSGIQTMTPKGNTMINLGLAWGWRTLSPNWQNTWSGLPTLTSGNTVYSLPLPYSNSSGAVGNMIKVVVLMTDGMNTVDNTKSAYGSNAPSSVSALDNETIAVCQALKNNGVIIYTIGFGQNGNDDTSDKYSVNGPLLQACASKPSYYFLAPTNAQLGEAFAEIGNQLANLRVSQ